MKTRAMILALTLAAMALLAAPTAVFAGPDPAPLSRLVSRDGFLFDGQGRVVLLRGANVPAHTHKPIIYGPADVAALKAYGFNFIRLGISWDKAEPVMGQYDMEYIRSIAAFAKLCGEAGIYVMPEVHKFGWCAPGSDVPTWACNPPVKDGSDFINMSTNANRFWNDPELQDRFIALWKLIVPEFRDLDCVMGYNPMNEPLAPTMFLPGYFDLKLFAFYDRWLAAIRPLDPLRPVVLEPCTANMFVPMLPPPGFHHDNLVYAPHPYYAHQQMGNRLYHEPETSYGLEKKYFRNWLEARRLGGPLLVGEYGGDPGTRFARRWLKKTWRLMDRYFIGAAIWVYDKGDGGWAILDKAGEQKPFFRRHLRRPYPRATAGRPVELKVDTDRVTFVYRWKPDAAATAPTEIFVPREWMKKKVTVKAGKWRYDDGAELLIVENPKNSEESSVVIE